MKDVRTSRTAFFAVAGGIGVLLLLVLGVARYGDFTRVDLSQPLPLPSPPAARIRVTTRAHLHPAQSAAIRTAATRLRIPVGGLNNAATITSTPNRIRCVHSYDPFAAAPSRYSDLFVVDEAPCSALFPEKSTVVLTLQLDPLLEQLTPVNNTWWFCGQQSSDSPQLSATGSSVSLILPESPENAQLTWACLAILRRTTADTAPPPGFRILPNGDIVL